MICEAVVTRSLATDFPAAVTPLSTPMALFIRSIVCEMAVVDTRPARMVSSTPSAKRVKLPMERVFVNVDRYGNTSAASVPLALDEVNRQGRIKPGDNLVMVAFGGGLIWGATVVKW